MSKFEFSPVVKAFREHLLHISDTARFTCICGVSGGIDSMVLLYLLHRHQLSCTVAHCNYQLRGEASDKDMELVEQVSAMWGFECVSALFDPEEADLKNTQLWARQKRYRMFRDLKKETDADFILTAHHQGDQVETILQKIFRGSSMPTWKGMSVIDREIFRPLLSVTRSQIQEFAEEHHVPFREDHTNAESSYARNLIRNELSGRMNKLLPGWRKNVLKVRERAAEYEWMASHLYRSVRGPGGSIRRENFLNLPRSLWPVIIHIFFKEFVPSSKMPSAGDFNETEKLEHLQTGSSLRFGKRFALVRDRDRFLLVDDGSEPEGTLQPVQVRQAELPSEVPGTGYRINIDRWDGTIKPKTLQLDAGKISWPVTLRRWQQGDQIQPLGMSGHKLISDVLTDHKISTTRKKEAILIESFDGTVSAIIFPHITKSNQVGLISEKVKCSPGTKQVLQIDTGT